ncbi:hypothetical protein CBY_2381 [Clostridium butyricum 5521]|uniref:Uncharacterized protein n=1 Tax=Clostridium butyricum E4 str. BoNT E BL5262 TaxID=632245 RepID=C4IC47_CLOBU|nr:hypothetical protein CBY_2381 [Clostridium butyricum 5521]EEP56286.1 hypothetical protein CLP_0721 [Clostridium butyricum E4 str. BoNT E BL5262]
MMDVQLYLLNLKKIKRYWKVYMDIKKYEKVYGNILTN